MPALRKLSVAAGAALVSMLALGCGDDGPTGPQDSAECAVPVGAVAIDGMVAGTLTSASCLLADQTRADVWTLEITAITTLQLDLASDEFDAVLFVRNSSGRLVVEDDDSGPDLDSRIIHTFGPGSYRVFANTFETGELGSYTLTVADVTPP